MFMVLIAVNNAILAQLIPNCAASAFGTWGIKPKFLLRQKLSRKNEARSGFTFVGKRQGLCVRRQEEHVERQM